MLFCLFCQEIQHNISRYLHIFYLILSVSLKPYFFILLMIWISSSISVGFLLFYMNPETDPVLAFSLLSATLALASMSFLTGVFFFIKKIYYRWDVTLSTMSASIRQAILCTVGIFIMAILFALHIFEPRLALTAWTAIACLEVMIQAVH